MKIKYVLFLCLCLAAISSSLYAQETVEQLKEKIIQLQNRSALGIKNFNYCSAIESYGSYTPIPGNQVKAGSKMQFYFEPANLSTNTLNKVYQVSFNQDIVVLDEKNSPIINKTDALKFNYQTKSPVMDFYITNSLNTAGMPPGKYTYKAVLHDKIKNQDTNHNFPFEIVP